MQFVTVKEHPPENTLPGAWVRNIAASIVKLQHLLAN
jgi:hypothetical protein